MAQIFKNKFIKSARIVIPLAILVLAIIGLGFYFFSKPEEVRASPSDEYLTVVATGDETYISNQAGTGTYHWDKVAEYPTPDDTTYVYTVASTCGLTRDLYNLSNHITGTGTINSVTIYARLRDMYLANSFNEISIKTEGAATDTAGFAITTSWANYSYTWTTNPTTHVAWTWTEVDALQAGVNLYGSNTGGCSILKGQKILMADNSQKNIENIQVGDEIISYNLNSQKTEKDKVTNIIQGNHDDYLVFNGILKTSTNHVIWANGGFKPAEDIKIGDFLLNSEGQEVKVAQIQYIKEKVDTYDLEIEKNHNFFASGYLVHNYKNWIGEVSQIYADVNYSPVAAGSTPIISTGIKIGSGMKIK